MRARMAAAAILVLALAAPQAVCAAGRSGTRLWNLTGETLNRVELAPAGTTTFGPDQCANDKDGEVDFDEHLAITGVEPGRYDIRVRDTHGRTCLALGIEVQAGKVFAIHEKNLSSCSK